MRKQTDRWELAAPFDALSWALCLKNRRAARALLEKRETLTWIEGSEYAPMTLGWAPELLEMILDRVPEGEEELFCVRGLLRPGDGRELLVENSLLTAAAAMDDLEAVELLLARGNCALDENELHDKIRCSLHYCELGDIRSNLPVKRLYDTVYLLGLDLANVRVGSIRNYVALHRAGPLSSAVLCGAKRCALRLLEVGAQITLTVRRALTMTQLPEDERYRAAVEAVTSAVGAELPDLLDPMEFADRKHPLFLECVKRHAAELSPGMIGYVFMQAARDGSARELLRRVDPLILSGWLLKNSDSKTARCSRTRLQDVQWIFSDRELELVLDRNNIPSRADMDMLSLCLVHARLVGDVPKGALSSLAVRLLDDIIERSSKNEIAIGPGPVSNRYRAILREEDSNLIWKYLDKREARKSPAFLAVLSLLRGSRSQPMKEKEAA